MGNTKFYDLNGGGGGGNANVIAEDSVVCIVGNNDVTVATFAATDLLWVQPNEGVTLSRVNATTLRINVLEAGTYQYKISTPV